MTFDSPQRLDLHARKLERDVEELREIARAAHERAVHAKRDYASSAQRFEATVERLAQARDTTSDPRIRLENAQHLRSIALRDRDEVRRHGERVVATQAELHRHGAALSSREHQLTKTQELSRAHRIAQARRREEAELEEAIDTKVLSGRTLRSAPRDEMVLTESRDAAHSALSQPQSEPQNKLDDNGEGNTLYQSAGRLNDSLTTDPAKGESPSEVTPTGSTLESIPTEPGSGAFESDASEPPTEMTSTAVDWSTSDGRDSRSDDEENPPFDTTPQNESIGSVGESVRNDTPFEQSLPTTQAAEPTSAVSEVLMSQIESLEQYRSLGTDGVKFTMPSLQGGTLGVTVESSRERGLSIALEASNARELQMLRADRDRIVSEFKRRGIKLSRFVVTMKPQGDRSHY